MNYLAPIPKQFVDQSGVPYSDGTVTVYLHGSTAKATLYASATGDSLSPNPVVLDSNGAWKAYVKPTVGCDYVVKDKYGNVVFSYENVIAPAGADACLSVVAHEYSDEEAYASGTIVTRLGVLYIANVDIDEAEDWNAEHWTQTTVADCMPILFECTEPNWPDAALMYEAVKAGRLAGINRLSFNGETRKIWLLTDIGDRTITPEYHKMEFRVDDDSSCERVLFRSTDGVDWTVSTTTTKLAIRGSVANDWSSADVAQYHAGTLRYRNGILYRCLTDSPSSTWVAAEWVETNIADEMSTIDKFEIFEVTDSGGSTTFPTYAQITAAIADGKIPVLKRTNLGNGNTYFYIGSLVDETNHAIWFRGLQDSNLLVVDSNDGWADPCDIAKAGSIALDYTQLTFPVSEGTYCMHDGYLYYCSVPGGISTSEPWTPVHWTGTNLTSINVTVHQQTFTDAEKEQARANIGAPAYIYWDGTDTDNKYTEIKAAYDAGRPVLLYNGEDQFSEVVSKGTNPEQYNFMHIDKTYVELVNFASGSVTIMKFDNYGMIDGAVTARYNAGQILIDGMKPGMNASYTVDWATINAEGYHPTNFVIYVDRPDPSKALFFTLNVDIPYDATYMANVNNKNMWVTVHDNVSGQDLNAYAYQPELVMNYPSGWIYPPKASGRTNRFTIVCLGGCHFVLIRTIDAQIISGFGLDPTTDSCGTNGTNGLADNHPLGRATFYEHSNGAETEPYYLNGFSVPFKITNFDVKSYPYVLDAGHTPAMAWRSLDVDRPIKNVTKLGIVTYDTTYNLAHISGIFRIKRGNGGSLVPPLEKFSDATGWTRISTTDTRLVPPDSSTYNVGRDTEIFQVGHSSPIYYYEFQFTKIDFEPGYRYYIPVATYRNYDYDYCKVLAMYLHPTPMTPWVELTEDSDAAGTPSLEQRTSFYVAPPIRIGFTNAQGIACMMWI